MRYLGPLRLKTLCVNCRAGRLAFGFHDTGRSRHTGVDLPPGDGMTEITAKDIEAVTWCERDRTLDRPGGRGAQAPQGARPWSSSSGTTVVSNYYRKDVDSAHVQAASEVREHCARCLHRLGQLRGSPSNVTANPDFPSIGVGTLQVVLEVGQPPRYSAHTAEGLTHVPHPFKHQHQPVQQVDSDLAREELLYKPLVGCRDRPAPVDRAAEMKTPGCSRASSARVPGYWQA